MGWREIKMARANPNLMYELVKLGATDVTACYSCGVCTATCPLSIEGSEFPRKIIRYAMLGLEDKLLTAPEPWLCYYCGDCTLSCPRQADPAGFMMATRRYLTTKYDWTGISKRLYHSTKAKIIGILSLMIFTYIIEILFHGHIITDKVALETFAPLKIVETADIILGIFLASILIGNIYRMYTFIVKKAPGSNKIPLKAYLVEFVKLVAVHFLTQMRKLKCREGTYKRGLREWLDHFILMWGYALAFLLFAVFLHKMQTDMTPPLTSPLMILGILSASFLIYGTTTYIIKRLKRVEPEYKYSHSTDWMFLGLLAATTYTGILVGVFRHLGWPLLTYITYCIHMSLVLPLLALEVPFAKWSHLAYRPFALYFDKLRRIKIGMEN
jgi:ferredoxin